MLNIFSCACWLSAFPLWKSVYLGLLPIFSLLFFCFCFCFLLVLSCMTCLYILDINPLLIISFANLFSHSVGCLFILSVVSFTVQKLLSLIRSHLFIFAFVSFTLGGGSKKILLRFMSKSLLPVFSSRSFIVFSITFGKNIYYI